MAKRGRKLIEIDWATVDKLMAIQATRKEIAGFLGIDEETLSTAIRREQGMTYTEYYDWKSAHGRISLRRKQYQKAIEEGNPTMLIWLGKNWLGQTDKIEHSANEEKPIAISLNYNLDQL